jgi:Flp pilus assembly protein TadD
MLDTRASNLTSPAANKTSNALLSCLGILLLALVCYAPALGARFVWDDEGVTANPLLNSLNGLQRIWTQPGAIPNEEHYWPLTYTVFWIAWHLWGLQPLGYHLLNIILHAGTACLLLRLLQHLRVAGALLAALLFTVHPVHVESVAWVIELKDVLFAALFLASLLKFLKSLPAAAGRLHVATYISALVLYVASLLAKTTAVTLPAVALILLWWLRQLTLRNVILLVPFILAAATVVWVDAISITRFARDPVTLDMSHRILVVGRAAIFYPTKLLWPTRVLPIYPRWQLDSANAVQWSNVVAAVMLLAAVAIAARKYRGLAAAVLIYYVTLAPTIGFIPFSFMRHSYVANRYQYLPSAAAFALVGAAVAPWLLRRRAGALALCGAVVALLSALTFYNSQYYFDNSTLMRRVLQTNPASAGANYNYGLELCEPGYVHMGIPYLRKAVELDPSAESPVLALAQALVASGDTANAVQLLDQHLPLHHPAEQELLRGRALLSRDKGAAADHFRRAVQLDPQLADAWMALGISSSQDANTTAARAAFRNVLRIEPGNAAARSNLEALDRL